MTSGRPDYLDLACYYTHCAARVSDPQERARLLAVAREHGRRFIGGIPKRPPAVPVRRSGRARARH